jgi:hypothetical protein
MKSFCQCITYISFPLLLSFSLSHGETHHSFSTETDNRNDESMYETVTIFVCGRLQAFGIGNPVEEKSCECDRRRLSLKSVPRARIPK